MFVRNSLTGAAYFVVLNNYSAFDLAILPLRRSIVSIAAFLHSLMTSLFCMIFCSYKKYFWSDLRSISEMKWKEWRIVEAKQRKNSIL
jgi:hypothetical protein